MDGYMRLTKAIKKEIVFRVLEASDFGTRFKAVRDKHIPLLREYVMSQQPEGFYEATKNLPSEWFRHIATISLMSPYAQEPTFGHYECEPFRVPVAAFLRVGIPDNHPLVRAYSNEYRTIVEAQNMLKTTLERQLSAYTTTIKLLKDLPELKKFVPEEPKKYAVTANKTELLSALKAAAVKTEI
jgi:hypothetical protein